MASGLFELRKDPITSWWVATIVDRAFHRDRFARAAEPVDDRLFGCSNCAAPGDGVRTRMLKDFAFHVVGTDSEARELESDHGLAQVSLAQARATGSWRTVIAPTGEHRPLHAVGSELIENLVTCARDELATAGEDSQTEYLTVGDRSTGSGPSSNARKPRTGSIRSGATLTGEPAPAPAAAGQAL